MKKEELLKEIGELKLKVKSYKEGDAGTRGDLSEILGSYKMKSMMGYSSETKEITVLSWLQISAEIGKLLGSKKDFNLRKDVKNLQRENISILNMIEEMQHKLNKTKTTKS